MYSPTSYSTPKEIIPSGLKKVNNKSPGKKLSDGDEKANFRAHKKKMMGEVTKKKIHLVKFLNVYMFKN